MILVDTSVWIDHFEHEIPRLVGCLMDGQVITHVFVEGELASGSLRRRAEILHLLGKLPRLSTIDHEEVRFMVENERLHGRGVGWVDLHLIAAARATSSKLWSTTSASNASPSSSASPPEQGETCNSNPPSSRA